MPGRAGSIFRFGPDLLSDSVSVASGLHSPGSKQVATPPYEQSLSERERERERVRLTERQTDRDRQTETDRERERERERA